MPSTSTSEPQGLTLPIQGMTCGACAARLEKVLGRQPGILSATVNYATHRAAVSYDPLQADRETVSSAVRRAGFEVPTGDETRPNDDGVSVDWEQEERIREVADLRKRAILSGLLGAPVVVVAMTHSDFPGNGWFQWLLTTPVFLIGGFPFLKRGWRALSHGGPDMNTLVAIGTGAAYLFSTLAVLWPGVLGLHHAHGSAVYFESVAVIIELVLVGRLMEARARASAGDALRALMRLQPATALVVRGGEVTEIPAAHVHPGDLLRVRPGDRIPVDGVIRDGRASIDESMLTGESVPVSRKPGEAVFGATTNLDGAFTMVATRVGAETALRQIIRLVEEAQNRKAPIQRLADRVSNVFVPVVVLVALCTFGIWLVWGPAATRMEHALTAAISVLIIACPCALGLATPTAVLVGSGAAAARGILIRGGETLETVGRVNAIVLDKTGTLTSGKPRVVEVDTLGRSDVPDLLTCVSAVEGLSNHPLALAIVQHASAVGPQSPTLPTTDFQSFPGQGVSARVHDRWVRCGTLEWLASCGLTDADATAAVDRITGAGSTPVVVAMDDTVAAVIAIADTIRPETAEVVRDFLAAGHRVVMLTGDNPRTAQAMAHQAGITEVRAGVLPGAKSDHIRALQAEGYVVAMVGDGINDAPALAQADVGIAIGAGADVAMEAAEITLVGSDLRQVQVAIDISRRTMRTIRQNLFLAFVYNVLGIPLAAGLLYPWTGWLLSPMVASAAMALSSVSVVSNSLRLRNRDPRPGPPGRR